jgi:hypothetical protein
MKMILAALSLLMISTVSSAASIALIPKSPEELYSLIKDLHHPTLDDYRLIQNYLSHAPREDLRKLKDCNYEHVTRTFKIIGTAPHEMPRHGMIAVNCSEESKEHCILVYASFNRHYPKGLERLVNSIKASDFVGHILYRVGGWPDAEGGSLTLAHIPYAFKACFFKEAERLGYKRAFWLDTSLLPLVSLNTFFDAIKENGYVVMGNDHMVGPYFNESAAAYYGITRQEAYKIPSCSAGIFGVDFTVPHGREIIDRWYKAALDREAYYSARLEQNSLSIILYQMGLRDFIPFEKLPHGRQQVKADSLLLIDRQFVLWGR